jgi:hypothetical protein
MLIHSAVITGSVQFNNTDVSGITNVSSFATTASVDAVIIKTGSFATTSSVNELQSKTGSYASTSSVNNLQSVTGSYASTGSNQFNGNQSISGSITSNGTITAQTLVVQTVTSSIEFITGSTRNGSIAENTHQFTGSVLMSSSLGIGATSPDTSYNAGSWFNNSGLVVGNITSTSGIQINSSASSTLSSIRFGDGGSNLYDQGFINYNHNLDRFSFGTNRNTAMIISSSGATIFSNSVSAPYYLVTSNIPSSTASTGYLDYSGGGTRLFSVGTSGATKGTFRFIAKGADDSSIEPLGISATGAATFSSTVTTGDALSVGAGGGGGGVWTWGATEAYIYSPTSKNLNLTTDGGTTKGLRITTSGAATFSNNVTMGAYILNQNGVGRVCFSGRTSGNGSFSVTVSCSSESSMKVTCMFNHYGLFTGYGCAKMSFYANGPSSDESAISNITSGNGGSWSIARINNTSFSITKNAGSYGGDGYYFIEVIGANLT